MNKTISILFLVLASSFILSFSSCRDEKGKKQQETVQTDSRQLQESMEKANRYIVRQEADLINEYIERHRLDVTETGSGLRYQIINIGDDKLIKKGDIVTLEYEVRFLTGDLVYSSKENGLKTFVVGRGGVESGLEEAMLLLHKNDVAVLILPAHIAHGLLGDGNKIPARSTIVYRIKVVENQSKNSDEKD